MILSFDPYTNLFVVRQNNILDGPTETPVRDFYIEERKQAHITVSALERAVGLNHPALYNVEMKGKKSPSNSLVAILAGLEGLGFTIRLERV